MIKSNFWIGQIQFFAKGGDAEQGGHQNNCHSRWAEVRRRKSGQQAFRNQNCSEGKKQNEKRIVQKFVNQSQKVPVGEIFFGNDRKVLEFLERGFNF